MPKIVVLPGDGIGKEIIPEAIKVLKVVLANRSDFEFQEYLIGGAAIDSVGKALPDDTLSACKEADAVLLGAIGGPKWDSLPAKERPELGALLPLRKELNLYANIRPVVMIPSLLSASTLKENVVKNVNLVVFRELTGGLYFGDKGRKNDPVSAAYDVLVYTEEEICRIVELAFQTALKRKKKLCSVDKANVLESSRFWREITNTIAERYPEVELTHMYVDNAAMQLVRYPEQFDVIVTENMFGDILTDLASMLGGSIGMLPSASLNGKKGIYEPAHGSAPDIAGQNKANPLATILSAAMMLRYSFDLHNEAARIENAVTKVLDKGYRTADLAMTGGKILGTREMGDAVVEEL